MKRIETHRVGLDVSKKTFDAGFGRVGQKFPAGAATRVQDGHFHTEEHTRQILPLTRKRQLRVYVSLLLVELCWRLCLLDRLFRPRRRYIVDRRRTWRLFFDGLRLHRRRLCPGR